METGADISKIVGAIMQNPELIGKIKELASSAEPPETSGVPDEAETVTHILQNSGEAGVDKEPSRADRRRRELLCALKPYVSKERARAIDSMLSFATVFNIIKEK